MLENYANCQLLCNASRLLRPFLSLLEPCSSRAVFPEPRATSAPTFHEEFPDRCLNTVLAIKSWLAKGTSRVWYTRPLVREEKDQEETMERDLMISRIVLVDNFIFWDWLFCI